MAYRRLHSPYDRTTGQKVFAWVINSVVLCYAVAGSPVTFGVSVAGAVALIAFGN